MYLICCHLDSDSPLTKCLASSQLRPLVSTILSVRSIFLTELSYDSYKLHGTNRPLSLKSDVIRKRSRHEIRCTGLAGTCSETPSASPGASRRASPARAASPQTSAEEEEEKRPQFSYDDYTSNIGQADNAAKKSPPSDMLGSVSSHDHNNNAGEARLTPLSGFPGPYHPDYLYQFMSGADPHPIRTSLSDKSSEYGVEDRGNKRRRLSSSSYDSSSTPTDPPTSATSLRSSNHSKKSPPSSPTFSSYGLPYSAYNTYRGFDTPSSWMRGGSSSSSSRKIHPPMVLPEDAPMEYLHPPMSSDSSSSSSSSRPSSYLHPPMLPVDEAAMTFLHPPLVPQANSPIVGYSHPPMLPPYWNNNDPNYSLNDQHSTNSNDNSHMEMFEAMMNPME